MLPLDANDANKVLIANDAADSMADIFLTFSDCNDEIRSHQARQCSLKKHKVDPKEKTSAMFSARAHTHIADVSEKEREREKPAKRDKFRRVRIRLANQQDA